MKTTVDVRAELKIAWESRAKLWADGAKLRAEGDKLRAEGDKLWAEGNKIRAEGDKLWAEGDKLWAEGDKLWAEAILEVHGNIKLEWKYRDGAMDCHLDTGEVFRGDDAIKADIAA